MALFVTIFMAKENSAVALERDVSFKLTGVALALNISVLKGFSRCPLWVITGHHARQLGCPLNPQKRTFINSVGMSALGQKRTFATCRVIVKPTGS